MVWNHQPQIKILARRDGGFALHAMQQLLFRVKNGRGVLRMTQGQQANLGEYDYAYYLSPMLGETPLAVIQTFGCPTCASMLGAGWGIPKEDPALRAAADAIAAPYSGLEDALERLMPVLGLLTDGYYILCYSEYFPVDGEGHFFWERENTLKTVEATAYLYDSTNYTTLPAYPCFPYPTQSSEQLDEGRVAFWREKICRGEKLPPALAYDAGYVYTAFLLDGHHRAAACALEGVNLPCLTIGRPLLCTLTKEGTPKSSFLWLDGEYELLSDAGFQDLSFNGKDNSLDGKTGTIFTRAWSREYQQAAARYPTCWEAGALALCQKPVTPALIDEMLSDIDWDAAQTVGILLEYLSRQPKSDCKQLAMQVLKNPLCPYELYLVASRVLSRIHNDPEVEDFFVDILINCEDRRDPIWKIATEYWD